VDFGSDSDGDDAFRWDSFEQTALIQRCVNELFGFEPKDKQVEAIRKLLYDKSDLILIAKTGFGKSIVFLDCSKRGCEARPLRDAMVVSKVKIQLIITTIYITEGMFI
jgi:superfamily II DNA or RNA helicase